MSRSTEFLRVMCKSEPRNISNFMTIFQTMKIDISILYTKRETESKISGCTFQALLLLLDEFLKE